MKKIFTSIKNAIYDLKDGASIMVGGFGLCGNPENLISALHEKKIKYLTIISNNCGTTKHGLGLLLKTKQIKKIYASYVGENKEFEKQFLEGNLEVELNPQGTLVERIRAGGSGIPAFYTPTGIGTEVALGGIPMLYNTNRQLIKVSKKKEVRIFNKKSFILEKALNADFAIVKAHIADKFGNLILKKTTQNFSLVMCKAAKITIVEAEKIVDIGKLDPNTIHVPGIYINRIIQGTKYKKWIEQCTIKN